MDWETIGEQALADLRALLRFETVNPPGNEGPAAQYVVRRLEEAGLKPEVLTKEGRPNVLARLVGDGSLGGPLLLNGHLDVVPVEAEHWTHPPFAAEIADDYLYGRGTIDMKQMVAMCLTIVRLLSQTKARLGRDIIFAAIADEEAGCRCGSRFLVEEHPDKVTAECMLGEVGGFSNDLRGQRFYFIQTAEKGRCHLRLTARGEPGHGSVPHQENAVARLSRAIARLGRARLPAHRVPTVERWVRGLAAGQGGLASLVLPRVLLPGLRELILDRVLTPSARNFLAASLSNTVSPTILAAGQKVNVIPSTASAELDGRLLPGQRGADLVREIRAIIGPGIEIDILDEQPGRENRGDHPLLDLMIATVEEHDPGAKAIPYMVTGFTDAGFFGRVIPHCFGFTPLRYPPEDRVDVAALFHGHDERIHVPGFVWGLAVLWEVVSRFCVAPG